MIVKAKAVKLGDNVDTDVILPGKYLVLTDPAQLAEHAMEGISSGFASKLADVVIVAGENFGHGSSREHAPIALKAAGVRCIVAQSFARIFYRNAINIGLPVVECSAVLREINDGDELSVDLERGELRNLTTGATASAEPIPSNLIQVLNEGGMIEHLKTKRSHH
jgi:3-isopropylmalate/(R)-2-methylmalate dehydratase small subunit